MKEIYPWKEGSPMDREESLTDTVADETGLRAIYAAPTTRARRKSAWGGRLRKLGPVPSYDARHRDEL
jgi:hypothetical protein